MASEEDPKLSPTSSEIETVLDALRRQEVDAIVGDSQVLLLRLREAEKNLAESEARLLELNRTLETRIEKRTADLEKQTHRLRRLAHQLTQTEQRERKRLARVLHDGLQQLLIAIEVNLTMLPNEFQSEELDQARILLQEAIKASRSLAHEIVPPILYESTFSEALAWLSRWFAENYNFTVNVEIALKIPRLNENSKVFLFNIIRELLINSVKHSGVQEATIVCEKSEEDWWEIEVHDEGNGFDPASLKSNGKMEMGLGLLSIRERLFALGGSLTIESTPGDGAHFYIRLPVTVAESDQIPSEPIEAETIAALPPTSDTRPQGEKVRVLLVDDHRVVREAMAAMLQRESEVVIVGQAGDGLEAIEMTEKLLPDVIVMDISMPRMDGIEATRRIKEKHPEIHIIGLSLHEEADKARAMTMAGASTYLQKNAAAEFLIDTLLKL